MNVLCTLRDIYRALATYEQSFMNQHGITLNEGMLLCCVGDDQLAAGDIASKIDLSTSNCSKVIRSVEEKGLICRMLGDKDKRQMYFTVSEAGKLLLNQIHQSDLPLPELLQPIFTESCQH